MTRQYKLARKMKKIALTTAAKELEVSQPTLSNWESGRKDPSIDSLVRMSRYYGMTTDFLLGLTTDSDPRQDWVFPINPDILPALHGTPVFSPENGWAFVDAVERQLRFASGKVISWVDVAEVYMIPPLYAVPQLYGKRPLSKTEAEHTKEVWVEPISEDSILRKELRGWYKVEQRYVENEMGQRFYFSTYEAKWLAFETEDKPDDGTEGNIV